MSEAFDTPVWHNGKALRKGPYRAVKGSVR